MVSKISSTIRINTVATKRKAQEMFYRCAAHVQFIDPQLTTVTSRGQWSNHRHHSQSSSAVVSNCTMGLHSKEDSFQGPLEAFIKF